MYGPYKTSIFSCKALWSSNGLSTRLCEYRFVARAHRPRQSEAYRSALGGRLTKIVIRWRDKTLTDVHFISQKSGRLPVVLQAFGHHYTHRQSDLRRLHRTQNDGWKHPCAHSPAYSSNTFPYKSPFISPCEPATFSLACEWQSYMNASHDGIQTTRLFAVSGPETQGGQLAPCS